MALDIREKRASGVDLRERGQDPNGIPIFSDRRLYMLLQVFGGCKDPSGIIQTCSESGLQGAVYANVLDPYGVGVLAMSEDPDYYVTGLRKLLCSPPFLELSFKPEFSFFGRTYTIGYEQDLEEVLLKRPHRYVTNPAWPWAIWYPLRRAGGFEELSAQERRTVLMEHGGIGKAYGKADHVHDIRLACHGLDTNDNDFLVGLLGKALHPLSAIVQRMRQTRQTSRYLSQMGPFFVARTLWQSTPAL